jgi:hypothetical protein
MTVTGREPAVTVVWHKDCLRRTQPAGPAAETEVPVSQ